MIRHETLKILGSDSTPGLLNNVENGLIQLPEFQRNYLWAKSPDKVTSLLASIAQGWPAGPLLMMIGTRSFQERLFDGWAQHKPEDQPPEPKQLLLDGQQRVTALFQAYFGVDPDHIFFIAIENLLNDGAIDPEPDGTFRSMRKSEWDRKFGTIKKQREAGLITVSGFINDTEWEHWKDSFTTAKKADYQRLKTEGLLSGLTGYEFPVTYVLEQTPDEALAAIFVTINQQGIKLTTFDLAVARTVTRKSPTSAGFNLRSAWHACIGIQDDDDGDVAREPTFPRLRDYAVPPETVLRLILMMSEPESKISDGKILALKPLKVRQNFDDAVQLLDNSIEFLSLHAGLIPKSLADPNYLLPVALAAHHKPKLFTSDQLSSRVLQWYWCAIFTAQFGRGRTGDIIPQAGRNLLEWLSTGDAPVEVVKNFWKTWDQEIIYRLVGPQATNRHLMAALFSLEVHAGAIDWRGLPNAKGGFDEFHLSSSATNPDIALDIHHIFARGTKPPRSGRAVKYLSKVEIPLGKDAYEAIINRCLLLKSTNISIGSTPFSSVKRLQGIDETRMASYLVGPYTTSWNNFVSGRFEAIKSALLERVPKPPR